jgi:hypothetical protein
VAHLVEQLMSLAERTGARRVRPGPKDPALRRARVCYDHLAGDMGVAMLDALVDRGRIVEQDGDLALTLEGRAFATALGVDMGEGRRPACKACLDWSVRRSHLAGAMGAGLLERFYALNWARRVEGSRVVQFTPSGEKAFGETFGIALSQA